MSNEAHPITRDFCRFYGVSDILEMMVVVQKGLPFMNIRTSELLKPPLLFFETVSSVAPNACRTDRAAIEA